MTALAPLFPRQPAPPLSVETLSGAKWTLSEQKPRNFTMVVFYRGLHCPLCKVYLNDLQSRLADFAERGVGVFVLSSDSRERAEKTRADWGLDKLEIGYGLPLDEARKWGLYISRSRGMTSIGLEEPALFSEPGLFLVRADGTLYFATVQTMPFARPQFKDILPALDFVLKNDYPARGEVLDHRAPLAAE